MHAEYFPNEPIPQRGLLPLRAATTWLGLSDTRVTMRLVRDGKLKAIKIGRRIFITTQSLEKFVGVSK